jgi:hypothetical protein
LHRQQVRCYIFTSLFYQRRRCQRKTIGRPAGRDSLLEQKETIDPALLQQISSALKIPAEAIQNFDEGQAINIISNTFNDEAFIGNSGGTYHINPVDKLIQLHEEKIALYERMLKEKDEMMAKLEKLIEKKD